MRDVIAAFRHELALVEEHCFSLTRMIAQDLQRQDLPGHDVAFNLARSSRRRTVLTAFFHAVPRRGPIEGSDEEIRQAVGTTLVAALQSSRMASYRGTGAINESVVDLTEAFEDLLEDLDMTEQEFSV